MFVYRNINKTGPGVRNPLKHYVGTVKHSTRVDRLGRAFRTNDIHIKGTVSRYMPHQGAREIARRLRQAERNAA